MTRWPIPIPGEGYVEKVREKCYWELVIQDKEILLIQRGGPIEPCVLTIEVVDGVLEITDDWNWGCG